MKKAFNLLGKIFVTIVCTFIAVSVIALIVNAIVNPEIFTDANFGYMN